MKFNTALSLESSKLEVIEEENAWTSIKYPL